MAEPTRDRIFSLRLTDAEFERLSQAAAVHGVDRSTMVRKLIADAPLYCVAVRQSLVPEYAVVNDLAAVLRERLREVGSG